MRRIFLTGATGFLGSYVAAILLEKGFELTLLVRDSKKLSGKEKFLNSLCSLVPKFCFKSYQKQIHFVTGDLKEKNLGVTECSGEWDALVHCASSTDFNETNYENLKKTNVEGLHHVLEFAKEFKIPSFHYVSTAYACGAIEGLVKEEISNPPQFRNPYEKTKNQAERICVDFCKENNIRLTVLRPSIIVGDSKTARTLNFEGPYFFFKIISRLSHYIQRKRHLLPGPKSIFKLKVPVYEGEEQNLVPVDYVAHFIAEVVAKESLEGKIYHITNSEPPTCGDLRQACKKLVPFVGLEPVGDEEIVPENKEEALFADNFKAYWPYLKPRIIFDKTNAFQVEELTGLKCPEVNAKLLARFFSYALKTNFGKKIFSEQPKTPSSSS